MNHQRITIHAFVQANEQKVWDCYTKPEHITKWNFADPSWHCPSASNELHVGGRYVARMEARDGSFGFNFEVIYTEIIEGETFTYGLGDRQITVVFQEGSDGTEVTITFDPENENPIELQRNGWQAILNQFKQYVESKS
jgi:uncharacterized protein YndB with AHSA1/START domain